MKFRPHALTGLIQASGLVVYVFLIASLLERVESLKIDPPEYLGPPLFLLTFVTSALICGALTLFYPATLAFKGKLRDAIKVVAWTGGWLLVMLLILVALVFAIY